MAKQNLEEEAEGIPISKLKEAGAEPMNLADYLILGDKVYEPVCWDKKRKKERVIMTPTHYRKRGKPAFQD